MKKIKGRADTTAKKVKVINKLLSLWLKYPELRLGQLIENLGEIVYYVEDFDLIERLNLLYKQK